MSLIRTVTPRDIMKQSLLIGEIACLKDCKEMEQDFAQHLNSHSGVKIQTANLYITRKISDSVAVALQKFIYEKTNKVVLVDDIKSYKYILVGEGESKNALRYELKLTVENALF